MLLKDQGIGLRFYPTGNTSTVGVWLTRDWGKIATRMKGNQRAHSKLLGQADTFYTCELLFYSREQWNVHILGEVSPLAVRSRLREDWRACAVASYMAWLADRSLPFGPAGAGFYDLLEAGLDRVADKGAGPAYLLRFEARWLALLGALPDTGRCSRCRRELVAEATGWLAGDGRGMLCGACAADEPGAEEVGAAVRAALRGLAAEAEPVRGGLPAAVYRETSALLARLTATALDLSRPSPERAAALGIAERMG